MSRRFGELFSKKLQKVAHFVQKHEKSSISPKLATFRPNYHVSAFWSFFQEKVAEKGSFREKARKIIDLAKTCNSSRKLPCFGVLVNFSAKSWEKWLISCKMTTDRRFGQNFATLGTSSHVFAFRWTFQKKLQKVPRFVKQDEKSSILPKLCNFSNKLPCFGISMKFLARSCKTWLILWESTKNRQFAQNFATLGTSYYVFAFRWTFQKKVAKSASFPENARKIIDFVKTCNFSKKLPCLAFRWSFQHKVAKSASFRQKARKIIDFNKTCNFFVRTTMSLHLDELFRKKLQKLPHFLKKHEKSSIWPKLTTSRTNYHVSALNDLLWSFRTLLELSFSRLLSSSNQEKNWYTCQRIAICCVTLTCYVIFV